MSNKLARQSKIREIIVRQVVGSQEDLLDYLKDDGFETTQATLSRDLHEIGIVRVPDGKRFKYVFHQGDNSQVLRQIIGMEIVNILFNESAIVVKTMPGRAQGVGIYLDKIQDSHIIGTVAGDDSVIIIPDQHSRIPEIVAQIREIMQ